MKTAILTDTNSGLTVEEGRKSGIYVLPMPVIIEEQTYLEGVDITNGQLYRALLDNKEVSSSQPSPGDVMAIWDRILDDGYDELAYIPMSSGLSGSCQSAMMLAEEYEGRVQVVNNQRISVTQRQSALDALALIESGMDAAAVKEALEADKFNSSIYIMLDTLYYLKKGGRITPAAAALGTILRLKPVLQIQGEKLDAFAKARTVSQGKTMMMNAIRADMEKRFGGAEADNIRLQIAYTYDREAAEQFKEQVLEAFPGFDVHMDPLSLSIACHIGPGSLALACSKRLSAPHII